jgi:hypothetical protein
MNKTAIAAAGLLLAACGGGGDGSGASPAAPTFVGGTDVPVSATLSADGAYAFVAQVAATRDDGAEPLLVGDATLANSETDEPRPVQ